MMRMPFLVIATLPVLAFGSIFDAPEPHVAPSPAGSVQIRLADAARVIAYDVSPIGPLVALLVANPNGSQEIRLWTISQAQPARVFDIPTGFDARSIAWHPAGDVLFLSGVKGQQYAISRVEKRNGTWMAKEIYSSRREIRRLVVGPRPYVIEYDAVRQVNVRAYRLFFGLRGTDGGYSIRSITEDGKIDYQVVGRRANFTHFPDAGGDPSTLASMSALPVGFHPAGHLLLWEDGQHCVQVASYDRDHWKKSSKLLGGAVCTGTVSVTPNGAAILRWTPGSGGVELILQQGTVRRREATGYVMVSAPASVADGKGIVGIVRSANGIEVVYAPINVPSPDSVNAWMYVESSRDAQLLAGKGGLFRDLNKDQLYQLYDSELYYCGQADESTPTRPYLVTTDSFWELFAAAYEGMFIVRERQIAIPAFRQFVELANASLSKSNPRSRWAQVFSALGALQNDSKGNPEATRILTANTSLESPILGQSFDYGELKPRGHYTATPEAELYFRAFRYLTRVSGLPTVTPDELRQLPPEVKAAALRWISSYQDLVSPSRAPLIWQNSVAPLAYVRHPKTDPVLFPLSWGFDNETLFSTIYHKDLPASEQIDGPGGLRLQPSALDVAAALGSGFARELLADQIRRYPKLDTALRDLSARSASARGDASPNLYQRWIDALAEQWADATLSPNGALDKDLWRAKRLQTGLASWATLRHATVLVNERVSAECGEAGFELIVLRAPRGYVEPDPKTFGKIAGLFDAAIRMVSNTASGLTGNMPQPEDDTAVANESLRQGLIRRLTESATKARLFQSMAAKETAGQPLTGQEYEEILYFGRVAEHHFLVFKSLANKDLALSTPNPIPKIADVADVPGRALYLMAAVGRPMEWDHTVPFFGRHEIVKGAAYSFYEFSSNMILNDADWMKRLPAQPHPAWIAPYVSRKQLSCPPRDPF